ncbi:hypothetical protein C6P40_003210 [Pichia californica]|uniref:Uncharacterized protein n=1 Tax=Pichia californica TaxID=460514 RepID=A0A9P6WIT0_9ASCO|nr:hypothetical protein C6P42_003028 [[Candida] californica]KAG0686887.1 hypothetical protein C6P40_003210 [[Candida] californica]
MFSKYFTRQALRATRTTRSFSFTRLSLAQEDVAGAAAAERTARLKEFVQKLRANERVCNQLRSVQVVIASKVKTTEKQPTIMQQMQLLADSEVRAEMSKLSDIMKEEDININPQDVGFLMSCLKAQMEEEK